ncbi:hypothetical protein CYMTET_21763 [Cymbomonas tetramitiformis]|uniref:Leishmanolysin-like peptidase n=1 Tax=Cymbomonas tetramitiformis TaxID=36881 RepID=A0AAE0G2Q7_9CHLO|nr:hypothetical protein CYMTET_21763 [Cymbomonas tetramitiformis]KAK3269812.1 hypothetical protein CYMTET_21763 [Cymbomonas tetramitiformis]
MRDQPKFVSRFALRALLAIGMLGYAEAFCGVKSTDQDTAVSRPQLYSKHADAKGRILEETGSQQNQSGYLSVREADIQGTASGLRANIVWSAIENEKDPQQCIISGSTIQLGDHKYVCTDEDLITASKLNRIKEHLNWTAAWLETALRLKPVLDSITIDSSAALPPGVPRGPYEHSDVVIVMTAHPDPHGAVAGYASCVQRDQHQRCVAGTFNWCPRTVELKEGNEITAGARRLALHEVVHVLEGIKVDAKMVDDHGHPQPSSYAFTKTHDAAYNRSVVLVKSPRVLNVSREQYGCANLSGVPLEDQGLGVGAHWEARVMGPELMSYGEGVGEPYISDLTLAFLEDTGYYVANYSHAGRLVEPSAPHLHYQPLNFLLTSSAEGPVDGYTPPPEQSPGMLRWGRGEGCSFLQGRAEGWSSVAFKVDSREVKRYTCAEGDQDPKRFGCSYDNRMSAVCVISEYDTDHPADPERTCVQDPDGGHSTCIANRMPGGQIPKEFDALGDTSRGGFNSAMDYVPVRVGYWSCLDKQIHNKESAMRTEWGTALNFGSKFSPAALDATKFGGQAHCPECRCFLSSLMDAATANPTFPEYGLCYPSNCVKSDLLQVGIQKLEGVYWYRCPKEGGKMYIPRLTGSILCPPAKEFCKYENITGKLPPLHWTQGAQSGDVYVRANRLEYAETNVIMEWLLLTMVLAVMLLAMGCMCCCRSTMAALCCGNTETMYSNLKPELLLMEGHLQGYTVVIASSSLLMMIGGYGLGMCFMYQGFDSKYTKLVLVPATLCILLARSGLHAGDALLSPRLGGPSCSEGKLRPTALRGAVQQQAHEEVWDALFYAYAGLAMFTTLLTLSVLVSEFPQALDMYLRSLPFADQDDSDSGDISAVGLWSGLAAAAVFLGLVGCVKILTIAVLLESAFSIMNSVYTVAGVGACYIASFAVSQVKTPEDGWLVPSVDFETLIYILDGGLITIGILGIAYNSTQEKGYVRLYVFVGAAELLALIIVAGAYSTWWQDEELDDWSATCGVMFMITCWAGVWLLASSLCGAIQRAGWAQQMQRDKHEHSRMEIIFSEEESPSDAEEEPKLQRSASRDADIEENDERDDNDEEDYEDLDDLEDENEDRKAPRLGVRSVLKGRLRRFFGSDEL